jgi:hypothetical protein
MALKTGFVGLLLMLLLIPTHTAMAQESADVFTGTWKGDWGPSATDRNTVTLELKWNGKTLTGTVNPGPSAISIENASFDAMTMQIHLEASYAPRNLRYVVDGTVEKDTITGTWNHARRKGDFQVKRESTAAQTSASPTPDLSELSPDERRVVEYLLKDWSEGAEDFSITTVDMAMDALRFPPSSALRFRIGRYIKSHPELAETLRQWGWQTIVLTPNEKLVARAIVNREREKQKPPTESEIAGLVGITEIQSDEAVRMLAGFGILKRDNSAGGIGYVAGESRYLNWHPWLDFKFHRLTLSSGRAFCVN